MKKAEQAFEVIQGGKDLEFPITKAAPAPPKGEDWLRSLPNHTRFCCIHRSDQGSFLDTYGITAILDEVVLLYDFGEVMRSPLKCVISDRFSKDRRLIAVLPDPNPPQEGENNEHHLPQPEPREVDD